MEITKEYTVDDFKTFSTIDYATKNRKPTDVTVVENLTQKQLHTIAKMISFIYTDVRLESGITLEYCFNILNSDHLNNMEVPKVSPTKFIEIMNVLSNAHLCIIQDGMVRTNLRATVQIIPELKSSPCSK